MSGTYPTSPGFTSIGFSTKHFNLSSESISGRIQVRKIGGSRFEFSVSYPPMTASEFQPVMTFIASQEGMADSFQITLPDICYKTGTATGSAYTNTLNPFGIGDTNLFVDGFTGTLKAGDLVKFANHSKVYMIMSNVTGNGGSTAITIKPGLIASVPNDTEMIYDAVPFTVRLTNDVQEFSVGVTGLRQYEVDFVEVI